MMVAMRVIGAGYGRTGTTSLKIALERLGFGPCHHMEEVVKNPSEVSTWVRASRGEKIDWKQAMAPWPSALDFPAAHYYQELMAAFPDALVILTVRSPESWYQSMSETIIPIMLRRPNRWVMGFVPYLGAPLRVMRETKFAREVASRFADRDFVLAHYRDHIEEVKRVVPPEKLLVYEVKDGWAPLCAFLGVPEPSEPFPRTNDTAAFKKRVLGSTVISWILVLAPLALALSIVGWLLR
jgi:hypothetical protein